MKQNLFGMFLSFPFFFAVSCANLPPVPDIGSVKEIPETQIPADKTGAEEKPVLSDSMKRETEESKIMIAQAHTARVDTELRRSLPWISESEKTGKVEEIRTALLPLPVLPIPEPFQAKKGVLSADPYPSLPLPVLPPERKKPVLVKQPVPAPAVQEKNAKTEQTTKTDTTQSPPIAPKPPAAEKKPNTAQDVQKAPAAEKKTDTTPSQPQPAPISIPEPKKQREIYAQEKRELSIGFPGTGWIFLGEVRKKDGIVFLSKSTEGGQTTFSFRVKNIGEYTLEFQKQDLQKGTMEEEQVKVVVLAGEDYQRIFNQGTFVQEPPTTQEDRLIEQLKKSDPIEAASLNDEELLAAAQWYEANKRFSDAIAFLEEFIRKYPAYGAIDSIYFRLGKMYETPSDAMNIRKARICYKKVYDDFPLSSFAESAKERLQYIDRHFFNIR